jgi:hypothetical protein
MNGIVELNTTYTPRVTIKDSHSDLPYNIDVSNGKGECELEHADSFFHVSLEMYMNELKESAFIELVLGSVDHDVLRTALAKREE